MTEQNITKPDTGKLIIMENDSYVSLLFIDEESEAEKSWPNTEIGMIEDGLVYLGDSAGMMPPTEYRYATDKDLMYFLDMVKSGKVTTDSTDLTNWLKHLDECGALAKDELERLQKFAQ